MGKFAYYRDRGIEWLNSKRKFDDGITLLEDASFRPVTVKLLKRQGEKWPLASERLKILIQDLIKSWDVDEVEDSDAELGVQGGKIINDTEHVNVVSGSIIDAVNKIAEDGDSYPQPVSSLIKSYAKLYKTREQLHRKMTESADDASNDAVLLRKKQSEEIARITDALEYLYPIYESYTKDGKLPDTNDYIKAINNLMGKKDGIEVKKVLPGNLSKKELQVRRKHLSTKLTRTRNQLEYQQETKADKPNPLPDCPKRTKYENKIQRLEKEIRDVEYQIAQYG